MKKVCMFVQDPIVRGGIVAVTNEYRGSKLEQDYRIILERFQIRYVMTWKMP